MNSEFTLPHYVALWLKSSNPEHSGKTDPVFPGHQEYYNGISKPDQVLFYSRTFNVPGMFIVLLVSSDSAFEHIIENDPALRAGKLDLCSAVPFREPKWMPDVLRAIVPAGVN